MNNNEWISEAPERCVGCSKSRAEISDTPWYHPDGFICRPCRRIRVEQQIAKFKESEEDTEYTSEITCPNCGDKNGDSWEVSDNSGEMECGNCDVKFAYEREIEVTYSTKLIPPTT
jgi:hypothetical protein